MNSTVTYEKTSLFQDDNSSSPSEEDKVILTEGISSIQLQRYTETKQDTIGLLKKYGKAAVVRPAGFGKTVLCTDLSKNLYSKVLYIYPSEVIKNNILPKTGGHVTCISYTKIGRQLDKGRSEFVKDILAEGYNFVVFDECHHMGAPKCKQVLTELVAKLKENNIPYLGVTATPRRMDGFDVISEFFDNVVASGYSLDDAITDGLIPEIYYMYSFNALTYSKLMQYYFNGKISTILNKDAQRVDNIIKRANNILNAPSIITDAIDVCYGDVPSYMKIMVFFTTKEELRSKMSIVQGWFETAYPTHSVSSYEFTSDINSDNISKLDRITEQYNHIDIIFSINMLNEGYHVDNVTMCILLRPTMSPVVYHQQIGRSMQVGMKNRPIILDFVSNFNLKKVYDLKISGTGDGSLGPVTQDSLFSLGNITIIDKVAELRKILDKIRDTLPTEIEEKCIDLRISSSAPVSFIASELDIPAFEVSKILDKYYDILEQFGLQRQGRDYKDNFGTKVIYDDNFNKLDVSTHLV